MGKPFEEPPPGILDAIDNAVTAGACHVAEREDPDNGPTWRAVAETHSQRAKEFLAQSILPQPQSAGEIGERIRAWREYRGMTVASLSRVADTPASTIYSVESGRGTPSLKLLERLATALNATLDQLVAGPKTD